MWLYSFIEFFKFIKYNSYTITLRFLFSPEKLVDCANHKLVNKLQSYSTQLLRGGN